MEKGVLLVSDERLNELGISAEALAKLWENYEGEPQDFASSVLGCKS